MKPPLVFIHYGNSSYLKFTLKALRLFNPEKRKRRRNDFYLVDEFNTHKSFCRDLVATIPSMAVFAMKQPKFSLRWLVAKVWHRRKITGDFDVAVRRKLSRLGFTDSLFGLRCPCAVPATSAPS